MDRKLAEFVVILRRQGLRVAPSEAGDAARAVALLGYADRQRFRETLAGTLAKSQADRQVFDVCFDAFFRAPGASTGHDAAATGAAADTSGANAGARRNDGGGSGDGGGQGTGRGDGDGDSSGQNNAGVPGVEVSPLGEDLLATDPSRLALRLAQAADSSRQGDIRVLTQKGLFARRLLLAMGLDELERELAALDGSGAAGAARRAARLRAALQQLRQRVRDTVERNFRLRREQDRDGQLKHTDLSLLRDSEEVRAVVRRLAKKLVNRHRQRQRRALRGRLDVRATLRRNVAHDGILIDPRWRRTRKDRPRLLAVCDVSRSVSQYSRFLLLFLYSLQEVIPRLRSFVFTSSLHEVTELFAQQDVTAALDTVMERHGLGSTDYGRALADLEQQALRDIDRRSTLLMLGDARNNRGEPRLDLLQRIHSRARRVVWLNPEDRSRWGSGDSEMSRYATACSQVFSCRSLADLERIVDRLLRNG